MDGLGSDESTTTESLAKQGGRARTAIALSSFNRWRNKSWILSSIKAGSILVVVVNAVFGVLEKKDDVVKWLGLDQCYMLSPVTGKPDKKLPQRPCLSGRITFVKWRYPFHEPLNTADLPDRPNRIFQVVRVNGGQVEWGEQKLLHIQDNREVWQPIATDFYIALEGGQSVPSREVLQNTLDDGSSGFILRRINLVGRNCNLDPRQPLTVAQVPSAEFFVEDVSNHIAENGRRYVYFRTFMSLCGQDIGSAFRVGQDFSNSGYDLAYTWRDP